MFFNRNSYFSGSLNNKGNWDYFIPWYLYYTFKTGILKDYVIFKKGKFKLSFAWYDLWLGIFVDTNKGKLYICLIPTLLITISFKRKN